MRRVIKVSLGIFISTITACNNNQVAHKSIGLSAASPIVSERDTLELTPPDLSVYETGKSALDIYLAGLLRYDNIRKVPDSALWYGPDFGGLREETDYIAPIVDTYRRNTFSMLFYQQFEKELCDVYLNGRRYDCDSIYTRNDRTREVNIAGLDLDYETFYGFTFKGRKFYYFTGVQHMCNGSGCNYIHHFLFDVSTREINPFELGYVPGDTRLFGDADGDDKLDFIYIHGGDVTASMPDYHMELFSQGEDGVFSQRKDSKGRDYYVDGYYMGYGVGDSVIVAQKYNWPIRIRNKSAVMR